MQSSSRQSGCRDHNGQCLMAHRGLLGAGILQDLGAQVAAADGAQVLLVALPVAGVLVQHVRVARLHLRPANGELEQLDRQCLARTLLQSQSTACRCEVATKQLTMGVKGTLRNLLRSLL